MPFPSVPAGAPHGDALSEREVGTAVGPRKAPKTRWPCGTASTPNLHTAPPRAPTARVENRGMNFFARHPRARWASPVLVAALTAGGVATAQSSAGGQSDLAPRTAHDLLVDLQK